MSIITEIAYGIALNSDLETLGNLYFTNKQFREIIEDPYFREKYLTPKKVKEINNLAYRTKESTLTRNQIMIILILKPKIDFFRYSSIFYGIFKLDDPLLLHLFSINYPDELNQMSARNINDFESKYQMEIRLLKHPGQSKEEIKRMSEHVQRVIALNYEIREAIRKNSINILTELFPQRTEAINPIALMRTSYPGDRAINTLNFILQVQALNLDDLLNLIKTLSKNDEVKGLNLDFVKFLVNEIHNFEDQEKIPLEYKNQIIKTLLRNEQKPLLKLLISERIISLAEVAKFRSEYPFKIGMGVIPIELEDEFRNLIINFK